MTPEVQERIVSAIRAGNYLETAAAYAGVTTQTLHSWRVRATKERESIASGNKARENESKFLDFLDAVERARAEAEVRTVALIQQAAPNSWQAAAWYLERSHPKRWARREKVEMSGPEGGPITLQGLAELMGVSKRDDADAG